MNLDFKEPQTECDELIQWARKYRSILKNRTADEVAYFARMNNFTPHVIYQVFSHWHPQTGLDTQMREVCGVGSEISYLERMNPLYQSWRDLGTYLLTGQEFTGE